MSNGLRSVFSFPALSLWGGAAIVANIFLMVAAPGACVAQSGFNRAEARKTNFDYVTFYEMPAQQGASFSVESAGEISNLASRSLDFFTGLTGFSTKRRTTWNDSISSIAFNGAYKVTVYSDRNFLGESRSFTTTQRTLPGLDNKISSIRWEPLAEGEGQPRAIFYDRPNFEGNSFFIYPGESISKLQTKRRKSRSKDWEDEIRSIRIIGANVRVTMYADREYRGKRVTIRSDAASLNEIGFGASASSIRVLGSGIGTEIF